MIHCFCSLVVNCKIGKEMESENRPNFIETKNPESRRIKLEDGSGHHLSPFPLPSPLANNYHLAASYVVSSNIFYSYASHRGHNLLSICKLDDQTPQLNPSGTFLLLSKYRIYHSATSPTFSPSLTHPNQTGCFRLWILWSLHFQRCYFKIRSPELCWSHFCFIAQVKISLLR